MSYVLFHLVTTSNVNSHSFFTKNFIDYFNLYLYLECLKNFTTSLIFYNYTEIVSKNYLTLNCNV